ncbi:CRISPR-associated endoribonuclease Cas6 [Desulforamulus hydrothermalis]|uniref:CRISPR-associated endoribonuclease n=1 Tax=Desulforamulus hydrothermalis Lam5 = DSM 18033 TaxID=1121428 RepID=K8EGG3_9FIRM|nr:CRISPR-associated endoribonuclease Cas6 [Desulforamulus hydrothermalis]CCO07756.1 CRISPR-associated protein Cas6 [Desulforamulus hydrothermalis Lam5 = DSM 18033]SHH46813.1 CRISPR-associated protein, Cas6 family [Desulforamulus hydrothermalis Lam5 = DSM 18033]
MHLYVALTSQEKLELPIHYNHLLQAAVYKAIEPALAVFLHDKGYEGGGRRFKLFAFSRLNGRFDIIKEKNTLRFTRNIGLTVSSPAVDFCQSIANGLLTGGQLRLGVYRLEVKAVSVQQYTVPGRRVVLKTISPVVAYSTFTRPDGRKYTCYFQPGDPDCDQLIENNLRKKYLAFYNQEAPPGPVRVKPMGQLKLNIVNYKGTIIKGYSGRIELTGPQELLQMAVDAGMGNKNSQGFGCVEVVGGGRGEKHR